jgi:dihydroneopterin aldolase
MNKISIEGMVFFANHGFYEEENKIGGKFAVDITFETLFKPEATQEDNLEGTVNYEKVYAIVQEEMKITSKLLEHLAQRIMDRLYLQFNDISNIRLKVSKLSPPLGGEVKAVSILLEK